MKTLSIQIIDLRAVRILTELERLGWIAIINIEKSKKPLKAFRNPSLMSDVEFEMYAEKIIKSAKDQSRHQ